MVLHNYCYLGFVFFIVNFVDTKNIENVPSDIYINWTEITHQILGTPGCLAERILCNGTTFYSVYRSCQCDEDCWKYGDCCIDAAEKAWNEGKIVRHQQWRCEKLPTKPEIHQDIHVFMISLCPENFADLFVSTMCHRNTTDTSKYSYIMDVPVMSKSTGKIYSNVYCALCNNDTNISETNLQFHSEVDNPLALVNKSEYIPGKHHWLVNVSESSEQALGEDCVEIYFSVPLFESIARRPKEFRYCKKSIDDCINVSEKDHDRKMCSLFSAFVGSTKYSRPYKNIFCKECNNKSDENYCSDLETDVGVKQAFIPVSFPSYSALLDFNSLKTDLKNSRYRCGEGEIFDLLQKKCVFIYCSKDYIRKYNNCVQISRSNNKSGIFDVQFLKNSSSNNSSIPIDIIIDPNCHEILHKNVTVFSNKSVLVYSVFDTIDQIEKYELFNDTAMFVCVPHEEFCPSKYSEIQKFLTIICLPLSLISLAIFIVMTIVMRKYQKLPGKIILSLSVMLFLSQFLFIFINSITNKIACYIFAAVLHFSFLSTFFWINTLAVNLCRNLFNPQSLNDTANHLKMYCYYSLYAWLFPIVLVSAALIVDNTSILQILRPNYGVCSCWFSNAAALLFFFALPLTIILVENIVIFIITARRIQKTKNAVNRMDVQRKRLPLFFYIKLTLIMGLTWVVGIVASLVDYEPLWIAFIILNGLQGMFIFISFTLKESFMKKCREYFFCKCRRTNSRDISNKDTVDPRVTYTINASRGSGSQILHKPSNGFGKRAIMNMTSPQLLKINSIKYQ